MSRIAYLVSMYPAASHTFIRREIEALRNYGMDIATFSIRRPPTHTRFSDKDQEAMEDTVYVLPADLVSLSFVFLKSLIKKPGKTVNLMWLSIRHRVPGIKGLTKAFFYFFEALCLSEKLKRGRVTHIHNHFANASANVGYLVSRYLGITWSLTLHGFSDFSYPSGYLLPMKIDEADFVSCVSRYGIAQTYLISNPEIWGKVCLSRCGIDVERLHEREKDKEMKYTILSVGRLSPEKGQHGLLIAFSHFIEQGNKGELVIIGDGPERSKLEALAEQLNIKEHCLFSGQQEEGEVFRAMAKADLFVLSSFMEGLPVVLMEALGTKLPVIAPSVAGIPELVRPGETGILFTAGDWDELTDKIIWAANHSERMNEMAVKGFDVVMDEFNIKRAVLPLCNMFEKTIGQGE